MSHPVREREESERESIFQRPKGNLQFFAHRPSGRGSGEEAASDRRTDGEGEGRMEGGGQLPLTASASADGRRFNFLFVAVGSALDEVTVVP